MKVNRLYKGAAILGCLACQTAFATNGTMPHGYGIKAQGMGGVSVAYASDSIAAANNPAGMAFVGNRADLGVAWLSADRGADIPGLGYQSANGKTDYFIPDAGYNRVLGNGMTAGISVVGNGVGTKYGRPIGPPTNSNAESELMQVLFLPTLTYRINERNAFGVSLIGAYQRLKVSGVEHIGLANPGFDHSFGYGLGVGWMGQVANDVNVGLSYYTKVKMGKLDKYKTLLAGEGEFDVPSRLSLGAAWTVSPNLTVAGDLMRVNWNEVRSIGNSITSPGTPGASNGPGFGWRDQNIRRIGAEYRVSDAWQLRAGYSTGDQIIPNQETALNYLAPVTPRRHLSVGATWAFDDRHEASFVYTRAEDEKVNGVGPSAGINPRHSQDWLGVSFSWKM